jgi:hypothetical protein
MDLEVSLDDCDESSNETTWAIPTPEGVMEASPGDWIIKGVKGEFYPCKPDIFEAIYDEVICYHEYWAIRMDGTTYCLDCGVDTTDMEGMGG